MRECLEVREKQCERPLVGRMHELGAIETLLTLTLLHEQVIATVAIERQLAASGASDALFCATVGLELGHMVTKV